MHQCFQENVQTIALCALARSRIQDVVGCVGYLNSIVSAFITDTVMQVTYQTCMI